MKRFNLLLTVAGASVLLGALVSSASARNLSTSSQTLRAGFARVDFGGGFGTTECPLTLEGSLHSRTIAKVVGSLIGYITSAVLGTCIRGRATILRETLPWHVRYSGFPGTLPNITAIVTDVFGSAFRIQEPFGIACLASGSAITGTFNREAGGALTTAVISGTNIPTTCGEFGTLRGTSNSLTVLNSATRITVTLI